MAGHGRGGVFCMTDIIAIANPKGGSAKTSTAVNLSCALAATRRKVLLADLDPHCCASAALGFPRGGGERSLAGVLLGEEDLRHCIFRYNPGNFDLVPGHEDLTAVPVTLYNEPDGDERLKRALDTLGSGYDFIVLDCPPSLGSLTANALCAATWLLIPTPCDVFALDSMQSLLKLYTKLREQGQSICKLLGVLRTIYDEQQPLCQQISEELRAQMGELLFDSLIPYNLKIAECSAAGRPVMLYDKSSTGARAYLTLAGELLTKLQRAAQAAP